MKMKWICALLIALVASLTAASIAYAQEEPTGKPARSRILRGGLRGVGRVRSLGDQQFILEARARRERTVHVDVNRRYIDREGNLLAFEDVEDDSRVAVITRYRRDGELLARLVIVLPPDYDPSQRLGQHARGQVLAVDTNARSFTVRILRGEGLTYVTNANTVFRGEVAKPG